MGSVRYNTQRAVWMIDYIDATGKRNRVTIGPSDEGKRLAKKVLAQREAEVQLGIHHLPAARTIRFGEFAEAWIHHARARGLAPKTLETYQDFVEHHLVPWFGEKRLGALTRKDIEDYLLHKIETPRTTRGGVPSRKQPASENGKKKMLPPLSPRTVNHQLTVLKAILADAVDHGHLTANPATKVKALQRPDREDALQFLQPEEITRLLGAAEDPWRTLYYLVFHTGLRRGEALGLKWGDLDLRKGLLHVRRSLYRVPDGKGGYEVKDSPLKTRHSRRTVDLSPAVVETFLAFPAGDDPERDYVFRSRAGGPIDPDNVDRAWKRHLTAAGLADRPFHSTRHTHASLLIAAGVHPKAIQARLGHASITTTLNVYAHLMPSAFEGVGERLDALLARQQEGNKDKRESRPKPKPASNGVTDGIRTRDLLGHSQALLPG